MTLSVFPIDGELSSLASATDDRRIREVLSATLPEVVDQSLTIEHVNAEPIEYARRYRAVLRYRLDALYHGKPTQRIVYGKVFASKDGALLGPTMAALREYLATARRYTFNVPLPLGWRPDMQLALMEEVPGQALLSKALKARFQGSTAQPPHMSLRNMIDASAHIAATLHSSPIKLGRRRTLDEEIADIRGELADLQRISPELGQRLDTYLQQIAAYAEQSDPLPLGFCHGDYTYNQILFEGTRAGLVDYDAVCQAEPALDLGHFLAYLKIAGLRARKAEGSQANDVVIELSDRFLKTYTNAMGGIGDVERFQIRVAVYQMISLIRRAVRSWQKFKGNRLEHALVLIEEELACLPQLDY